MQKPRPTHDAEYYVTKLTPAIVTQRQRLWNLAVIVNACRDYFRGRASFEAVQAVIERARTFDEKATWRGVPEVRPSVVERPLTANPNRKRKRATVPEFPRPEPMPIELGDDPGDNDAFWADNVRAMVPEYQKRVALGQMTETQFEDLMLACAEIENDETKGRMN
jgi:hypothetical protein